MRVLALDLATCSGYACGSHAEGLVEHGIHRLPKTGEDVGLFLIFFRKWLGEIIERLQPGEVIYESPVLFGLKTNINTLRKLYGLSGMAEVVARDHSVKCKEENVETITTHFLGKGKGVPRRGQPRKDATVARCKARGWLVTDDNDADALALLDLELALLRATYALPPSSIEPTRSAA